METILMLSVLLVVGAVLDARNSRRIETLRQDMLTPEHLKQTQKSIKDSLNSKQKQTPLMDASEISEQFLKTLASGKPVKCYIQAEFDYIWGIAARKYGEDKLAWETYHKAQDRFQVDYYTIYLQQ